MNRPIRRVAIVAGLFFALLLGQITFNTVVREPDLVNDPLNRRTREEQFSQNRGAILAGGRPIATTTPTDDRYKYQRSYPDAELYAPITGYYSFSYGRSELEASYNEALAGQGDAQALSRFVDLVTGRTPQGAQIETTIDPRAQQAAFEGLDGRKGAVVAMDPRTGAILALVTSPSYDPNELASHDLGEAQDAWERLQGADGSPMANRAVRETYPPGSVFKLVTAAAALENGMSPDTLIDTPEQLRLPGTQTYLPNQTDCGNSQQTLGRALELSCNTSFANVGLTIGEDALRGQAEAFGFGERQLSDLNGAASRFPENPDQAQLAMSSIGQFDVAATPLQMCMVLAGIANGGSMMEPYLVDTVRAPDLSVISQHRPTEQNRVMSQENADALVQMMVGVVDNGTGAPVAIDGMQVGGKTGTAQSSPDRPPYAWFGAVAPANDPQIVVAVFVESADVPRNEIGGGRIAAPIAKRVIEAVLES
ncbi:peptidoglycan D,D-transpeptidase FtsI family protein [Parenemella sanctibonifatiensis]|uniref:Cell division protein FtsI n=1 Tax=Parenemella sanctibonifatiensis TaxID=2016505 RepID=A0A255ED41_9ACTN|nr:penicillin-binding protein 2 [Parenemella sanctibonifatiensis]OYN89467.1 cell division protein FtsI [Parenemella sanctibonifatiensis]